MTKITMPLFVRPNEDDEPTSIGALSVDEVFRNWVHLVDAAQNFKNKPKQTVGPKGLVYVDQRELATTTPADDLVDILGSEDATTCHIVILKHKSGACSLTHLDGVKTEEAVKLMITEVRALSNDEASGYSLYLFGGFMDERGLSEELSNEIIEVFDSCQEEILLEMACITQMNSCIKDDIDFPVIYGVAVNVKTGDIFHAEFTDKGPDLSLRGTRHYGDNTVLSIYNNAKKQIIIPAFEYSPLPNAPVWLQVPDHVILKYLSTSPQQEPEDFVENVRKKIKFTLENPAETIFKDNNPRVYDKNADGVWVLVCNN